MGGAPPTPSDVFSCSKNTPLRQEEEHARAVLRAPVIAANWVRRCIEKNLRTNGFGNLGTVVVDGTYGKKKRELTDRRLAHIGRICAKAH